MELLLEMAMDLAHEIQADGRFIRTQMASAAADEDEALQAAIGEFNLKRIAVGNEAGKEDKDTDKLARLDTELRGIYQTIMENPHMRDYNAAKAELDQLVGGIGRIIAAAAQGMDPEEAMLNDNCGGDCSGCAGCH